MSEFYAAVEDQIAQFYEGTPPTPPIAEMLGAQLTAVDDGSATVGMRAGSRFHNQMYVTHGSVLSAVAELAAGIALSTTLGEAELFTITGMQTNFLRPVVGGQLEARASVRRRGRTISYVDVDVAKAGRDDPSARVMVTCYHRRFAAEEGSDGPSRPAWAGRRTDRP